MRWKCVFLICEDHGDDINYVVSRIPSGNDPLEEDLELAKAEVEKNEQLNPSASYYITVEKVLDLGCVCGKNIGECVGDLSCPCSPVAICKKVDQEDYNPMDYWSGVNPLASTNYDALMDGEES